MKEVRYRVVVNDEEQYSVWPEYRDIPTGWQAIGAPDSRENCLAWIESNWRDLRPRSLRERLGGAM